MHIYPHFDLSSLHQTTTTTHSMFRVTAGESGVCWCRWMEVHVFRHWLHGWEDPNTVSADECCLDTVCEKVREEEQNAWWQRSSESNPVSMTHAWWHIAGKRWGSHSKSRLSRSNFHWLLEFGVGPVLLVLWGLYASLLTCRFTGVEGATW